MQNVNSDMCSPTQDIFTARQESPTSFPGYTSILKRQDESPPLFGNITGSKGGFALHEQQGSWPILILTLRLFSKRRRWVM